LPALDAAQIAPGPHCEFWVQAFPFTEGGVDVPPELPVVGGVAGGLPTHTRGRNVPSKMTIGSRSVLCGHYVRARTGRMTGRLSSVW
jgi:hypothetical protein